MLNSSLPPARHFLQTSVSHGNNVSSQISHLPSSESITHMTEKIKDVD